MQENKANPTRSTLSALLFLNFILTRDYPFRRKSISTRCSTVNEVKFPHTPGKMTRCSRATMLKLELIYSSIANTASSQWICTTCRSKPLQQLRKASTTTLPTQAPPPPLKYEPKKARKPQPPPKTPTRLSIYQFRKPKPSEPEPPPTLANLPLRKLTIAEKRDLHRAPLPVLNQIIGSDTPPKAGENWALDPRPWSERWDAYWDREAIDERTKMMYIHPFLPSRQ